MDSGMKRGCEPVRWWRHALLALLLLLSLSSAQATVFVVDTAADSGAGSLRDRIEDANLNFGPDEITFNIAGAGLKVIALASPLPTITDALSIDGYTQSDAAPNTLPAGSNAVIRIALNGSAAGLGANGLSICAPNTAVRGLAVYGFKAAGISVGIDAGNDSCKPGSSDGTQISGNFIGVEPNGTDTGNTYGVRVYDTQVAIGSGDAERNVIGANDLAISFRRSGTAGSLVESNLIGYQPDGDELGNKLGIELASEAQNVRIGADKGPNRIGNGATGIYADESVAYATLYANDFGLHDDLGIDLCDKGSANCPDGASPNDADDGDAGGNDLQNSPALSGVKVGESAFVLSGTLDVPNTVSNEEYQIAAYWSAACSDTGSGPGELFLGSGKVVISDGAEEFELELPTPLPEGGALTATATTSKGSTSELSDCLLADIVFRSSFE